MPGRFVDTRFGYSFGTIALFAIFSGDVYLSLVFNDKVFNEGRLLQLSPLRSRFFDPR
jgi:hypothetical protein